MQAPEFDSFLADIIVLRLVLALGDGYLYVFCLTSKSCSVDKRSNISDLKTCLKH